MKENFIKLFRSTGKKVAANLKDFLISYAKDPTRNKALFVLINYEGFWCEWADAFPFPQFDTISFNPKQKNWSFIQYFGEKEGYKETKIDLSL